MIEILLTLFFCFVAMGSEEFYFISGVYFLKENENEKYLPAELALVKYTFESGIVAKYHTYINPGKLLAKKIFSNMRLASFD